MGLADLLNRFLPAREENTVSEKSRLQLESLEDRVLLNGAFIENVTFVPPPGSTLMPGQLFEILIDHSREVGVYFSVGPEDDNVAFFQYTSSPSYGYETDSGFVVKNQRESEYVSAWFPEFAHVDALKLVAKRSNEILASDFFELNYSVSVFPVTFGEVTLIPEPGTAEKPTKLLLGEQVTITVPYENFADFSASSWTTMNYSGGPARQTHTLINEGEWNSTQTIHMDQKGVLKSINISAQKWASGGPFRWADDNVIAAHYQWGEFPDLEVTIDDTNLKEVFFPGDTTKVNIDVTNVGLDNLIGKLNLSLYLSKDDTLDSRDLLLRNITESIDIQSNTSETYEISIQDLPLNLLGTGIPYQVIAKADFIPNHPDLEETTDVNNIDTSKEFFVGQKIVFAPNTALKGKVVQFTNPFSNESDPHPYFYHHRTILESGSEKISTLLNVPNYLNDLLNGVESAFANSGIENVRFEIGVPEPYTTTVYFSDIDAKRSIYPNWGLAGKALSGVDRYNEDLFGEVIVFLQGKKSSDIDTIAHELGHTLGLHHVNPIQTDDPNDQEIMDYTDSANPVFINARSIIGLTSQQGGPNDDKTHNPYVHLKRYIDGKDLSEINDPIGTWDKEEDGFFTSIKNWLFSSNKLTNPNMVLHDVTISEGVGDADLQRTIRYFNQISLGNLTHSPIQVDSRKFVQILASSSPNSNVSDLIISTGDPFDENTTLLPSSIDNGAVFLQQYSPTQGYVTLEELTIQTEQVYDLEASLEEYQPGTYRPGLYVRQDDRVDSIFISGSVKNLRSALNVDTFSDAEIRFSKDKVWGNDDDIVLSTVAIDNLDSQASFMINYSDLVPQDAVGRYFVGIMVDSTNKINEIDEQNNIEWSDSPDVRIGNVEKLYPKSKTQISDIDYRNESIVQFTGPGEGEALTSFDGTLHDIYLRDTTDKTKLSIKGSKKESVSMGNIYIDGSMNSIIVKDIGILGDISLSGRINTLTINDIADNAIITVDSADKGFKMKAGDIGHNVTIDVDGYLNSFSANTYKSGSLSAYSIGKIAVKQGDFGVDVLAREGGITSILATGDISGKISAYDTIGKIMSKKGDFTGVARAGVHINSVAAMNLDGAIISSAKDIGKVSAKNNILDSYILGGYDIGPDRSFGGGEDILGSGSINSVFAKGMFSGSYISAGALPFSPLTNTLPNAGTFMDSGSVHKLKFGSIDYDNNGDPFGILAATEIKPFKVGRLVQGPQDDFIINTP